MANLNIINTELDALSVSKSFKCLPQNISQYITEPDNGLKILHMNIRSINKNFDELSVLTELLGFQCDVIVLSECWLSKVLELPILEGYNSYSTKNNYNQNDGCAIYIKSSIKCEVQEPQFAEANCLICHLSDISIIALYRSPSFRTIDNFIESLDQVLKVPSQNVVLIGDINIDIKDGSIDRNSDEYLSCAASNGFLPAHLFPTRHSNCLDHALLKTNKTATTVVIESSITDHEPVVLYLHNLKKPTNITQTKFKTNYNTVVEDIINNDWSPILQIRDPNTAADTLVERLSSIIKNHTQEYTVPRRQRILKPWITPGLVRCIRNRDRLHSKLKRDRDNEILKITYTRYRNHCNLLLRKLKNAYEKQEFHKAKNNIKATWDVIKKVSDIQANRVPPTELLYISDSPRSSLNMVNNFFANIGKNLATKIAQNSIPPNIIPPNNSTSSMVLLEVNEKEVENIILGLRLDCATGWDSIPAVVIRSARQVLVPVITHICNVSISSGVFPEAFKKAVIHPVHKAGRKDELNNYRPISILTALSKILERILNNSLISFLEANKILADNQFGFRKGMSTEDAVLALSEHAAKTLDKKSKCLGIFIDLTKAFDTVSAPALLEKMQGIGIRGPVLDIFTDYLRGRTQYVKIGKDDSEMLPVTYGVPQGSILGPTLFLIYINELCKMSIQHCKIFTYADDTALIIEGVDWVNCYSNAEKAVRQVMNWFTNNLLTLNVQKTVYIPLAIKSNLSPPLSSHLKAHTCTGEIPACDCLSISRSTSVKYLGIHIDQHLNWHKQIEILSGRIRKIIYVFKKLRRSADQNTLKMVYYALCQSVISYCIPVWGGATVNVFIKLERAQRAVLKVMLSRPRRYCTSQLYAESDVLTVRQLYVFLTVIRKHSSRPQKERAGRKIHKHKVFPREPHRTAFAGRQYYVGSVRLYNYLNGKLNLFTKTKYECKHELNKFLSKLTYKDTEDLLLDHL